MNTLLILLLSVVAYITYTDAHGALTNPPARNTQVTFWDYKGVDWNSGSSGTNSGFKGPWTDPQVTSVCGAAAWDEPGPVLATYTAGSVISVEIAITAPHGGYHEFRICDRSPSDKASIASCLLNGPLLKRVQPLPEGSKVFYPESAPKWNAVNLATRWRAPSLNNAAPKDLYNQDGTYTGKSFKGYPIFKLDYQLPAGFTCNKCIFNWFYQSTNSANGGGNELHDVQGERFWNCADIKIVGGGASKPPTETPPPTVTPTVTPPTVTPPTVTPPAETSNGFRCGSDWADANSKCGKSCTTNNDCPAGTTCFNGVAPCNSKPPVESPPPKAQPPQAQPPQAASGYRCGKDWSDADSNCKQSCTTNDDCSGGETCFNGVKPCQANAPVNNRGPTRCGKDWMHAKSNCNAACSTNAECFNGEFCFGGLGNCGSKLVAEVEEVQLAEAEVFDDQATVDAEAAVIAEEAGLAVAEEAVAEEAVVEVQATADAEAAVIAEEAGLAVAEDAVVEEVQATADAEAAVLAEEAGLAVADEAVAEEAQANVEVAQATAEEAQANVEVAQATAEEAQANVEVVAEAVEDVQVAQAVEEVQAVEVAQAVEDVQVAQAVEEVQAVEVAQAVEEVQAVEVAQAVEEVEAVEDVQVAEDVQVVEDVQASVEVVAEANEDSQAVVEVVEEGEDQAVAEVAFVTHSAEAIDGDYASAATESDFATYEANADEIAGAAGDPSNTLADRSSRSQLAPYQVGLIVVVCVTIVVTIVVVLSVKFVNKRRSARA